MSEASAARMNCSQCQAENRETARFCRQCGAPLVATCARCGAALEAGSKFCDACGTAVTAASTAMAPPSPRFSSPGSYTPKPLAEKILTSRSAVEGERKQVTVLLADLKGSMELLADRDPEEARKILDPVLERMMDAVHRYEGTVNQVMGDGIMALFGAPIAHEDHAVRACYAALRMQDSIRRYAEEVRHAHGINVQIRVGLNSGEVVVRAIGGDLHMDYTAVGQTTHLAARMEQLASPGNILLTPSTLDLVEGYVTVRALGPVPVKGLRDRIDVYEATGAGPARTRFQATMRRGLTRFVGRDPELEHLRRTQALVQSGDGQLVAIVGEAGVGKSRLVYEFVHSHRFDGWLTLEAPSMSYGKSTSYLPVVDLLKSYFKITDRDEIRELREKATGKLLTLDESLKPTLTAMLALLDVPLDDAAWRTFDPAERRRRTLEAVRRLLLREAREQPVLLVFEDLHWVDGETQALLDAIVESLASVRVLLLVNYRPEYQHGWGSKRSYSQLRLDALPVESSAQLLDALLGDDPSLGALKGLLVKRGNPFFLEETVRTLIETKVLVGDPSRYRLTQPIATIQVPGTVQSILAARIDRLAGDDKRLLQTASVVGKDVPLTLLQRIADLPDESLNHGLERLQAAEFLYETGLYPDLEYTFKHALTHDVTYGGLLHERRRELHARIVEAIETVHRDRLSEHVERLAHHASAAELWDKAGVYLRESGRKALARSASRDAADYFERAIQAIDRLPGNREALEHAIDARIEARTALQVLRDVGRQEVHLTEAVRRAEALGDQRRLGQALMYAALHAALIDRSDEALRLARRASEIASDLGDLGMLVGTGNYLAITEFNRGNYHAVERHCEGVIGRIPPMMINERFGQARIAASLARAMLGLALAFRGRFSEALGHAAEALRIAEAAHHAYTVTSERFTLGVILLVKGDDAEAIRRLEGSHESWQMLQSPPWTQLDTALGVAYCRIGDFARGLQLLERTPLDITANTIYPAAVAVGEAYLLAGRVRDAAAPVRHALEHARESGARGREAVALHLLAEIAACDEPSHPDRAVDDYRAAQSLAAELGMRPLVAHCHLGLGRLFRREGKQQDAQAHLAAATAMYREMDMTSYLRRAEARQATDQ